MSKFMGAIHSDILRQIALHLRLASKHGGAFIEGKVAESWANQIDIIVDAECGLPCKSLETAVANPTEDIK